MEKVPVKVKKKIDRTIITRPIHKTEQISTMEVDIVNKGEIPGLTPVSLRRGLFGQKLRYEAMNMIDMTSYLSQCHSITEYFDIVLQIITIFLDCQAHGIRTQNLEMEVDHIFYDYAARQVKMIYWPLIVLREPADEKAFFYRLANAYLCPEEEGFWMNQYMKFFEQRSRFDVYKLREAIVSIEQERAERHHSKRIVNDTALLNTPFLVHSSTKRIIELKQFPFVIGRKRSTCDYVIEGNNYVGREHLELVQKGNRIFARDLNSANGSTLDGRRLDPNIDAELITGSQLLLCGREEFIFYEAGAHAE